MTSSIKGEIYDLLEILYMHIDDGEAHDTKHLPILVRYWAAKYCEGYHELTNRDQVSDIFSSQVDEEEEEQDKSSTDRRIVELKVLVSAYRISEVNHIYRVYENEEEGKEQLGIPGRVFRSKRVEESPNISHYSKDEYPRSEFALDYGITSSLCLPVFATNKFSDNPNGVLEVLFTSYQSFRLLRRVIYQNYCSAACGVSTLLTDSERMYVCRYSTISKYIGAGGFQGIDVLLKAVCRAYPLPLAQCWIISNNSGTPSLVWGHGTPSLVSGHASSRDLLYSKHWHNFREACTLFCSYLGDGLVSKTFQSRKSYFCKDITGLKITDYPLVHYVRDCGSIACFTIYLYRFTTRYTDQDYTDHVLEFFVPYKEMDVNKPHIFLNSLFAIVKEYRQYRSNGFIEEDLFFEVIDSSMLGETMYLKIGHPAISLPHHNGSQKEKDSVPQLPLNWQSMVEDGWQPDQNVLNVHDGSQKERDHEGSQKEMDAVPQLPLWQFTVEDGQQRDENVLDVEENYSALGETSRKRDSVAEIIYVDNLAEESLVKDTGDTMNTESQPLSTMKLLPQVQGTEMEEERLMQPRLQESAQNKAIIVDAENYGIERTPGEKRSENGITLESLSEHFGTQLNDAAKSFGVSRSTLKRICRSYGIKKWQSGKRRVGTKINDGETSIRNFSSSEMLLQKDTPLVVHPEQYMDKMTVKATCKDVNIVFDLLNSSGMTDLEDNVTERLHLERKKFTIEYQDGDGDWILIACDKDVSKCMEISRSLKKATIKMSINRHLLHSAP